MRLAIDAFRLVDEPGTSGATYVAALAKALAARREVGSVTLLVPRAPDASFSYEELYDHGRIGFVWPPTPTHPAAHFRGTVKWIQRTVPRLVRGLEADWYLAPYHQTPVALPGRVRVLTVIHDVCGLLPSAGYRWNKRAPYRHLFNFLTALWRSDGLVYISNHTKSRFERLFPLATRKRSRVIFNQVGQPSRMVVDAAKTLGDLGLERGAYFLAFASPSPRKGLDLALASFRSYLDSGGRASLVLVAPEGFLDRLRHRVGESQLGGRVKILSWVSERQRDALYWGALALLFPSRCEGFGYPIAEALAWGCPPIAWRRSPASEIVEGDGLLVERLDPIEIARTLHTCDQLSAQARGALSDALRKRARELGSTDQGREFVELFASFQ